MPLNQIPNAFQSPRWWQTLHYTVQPLDYMEKGYQRCGDIFNAPVVGKQKQILFVSDPEAIKQIFTNDTKQIFAPANQLLRPLVGERSIFGMENARHRRERRLLMPSFHRDHITQYGELICQLTREAIEKLSPDQPFTARVLMQDISLEVILKVVFGIQTGQRFETLKVLIVQLTDLLQQPFIAISLFYPSVQKNFGPWGRFLAVQKKLSEALNAEIRERRQQDTLTNAVDILSILIQTRDDEGTAMSDAELHDELMTLLIAGHETTASSVAWALYWIHRDRQVYARLMDEFQSLGSHPEPMVVSQLPYLAAVCNETLRIYPVAFLTVPREVRESITLMDYALESGTRLYGCIYLVHHRPDLYPNPDQFIPERFLEREFSNFEFFPFGGGIRRCIGEALAQFEMKLVLTTMLRQGKFNLAESEPENPKRRGVTLAPERGVKMVMKV